MNKSPAPRDEVLTVLSGRPAGRILCFSGLISVTQAGLDGAGYTLPEVHRDARKMATAAATTHRVFGFDSVALPLDMCVEAQMLGAAVDFGAGAGTLLPQVAEPLAASVSELEIVRPPIESGRIPVVCNAISLLKEELDLAIGGWVPGPFTLASMLVEVGGLLMDTRRNRASVGRTLDALTDLLVETALGYHRAGADYLTIHEMGGSPGFIGPGPFEELVLPRLQRLCSSLPRPHVLHVCGRTNFAMELLAAAGADALSVDQLNDLRESRDVLGSSTVLLGNIDPVAVLRDGSPADARRAVSQAIDGGATAVWPGCDLVPLTPAINLKAMVEQTRLSRPQPDRGG